MIADFDAEVFRWDARTDAHWYFAALPPELGDAIRETRTPLRRGFGAVRVDATIGGSSWRTSVFPDASGVYVLPLKRAVRDAERLVEGGPVLVHLEVIGA